MKRVFRIVFLFSFLVCALNIPGRLAWAGPNEKLIDAAFGGDVRGVEAALKAGADVNARDTDGTTALIEAAFMGRANVIPLLLKAGADVNAKANNGSTALLRAAGSDLGSHANVIRLLLKAGADVNARTKNGSTALIRAAFQGHANYIPLLLKAGADVNARNTDGTTALLEAVYGGYANMIPPLLRAGADVNARNMYGSTAEGLASGNGMTKIISLLDDWKARHSGTAVASNPSSAPPSDNGSSSPPPSASSGLSQTEAQDIAAQAAKQAVEQANARNAQELAAMNQKLAALSAKSAPPKTPAFHSSVDHPTYRESEHRKDFSLVVGVEKYQGGIPRAQFADRDARAVARHLRALGIPPDHMTVLSDDVATRGRIKEALAWLKRNVKSGSTVWVYFSGHGAPNRRGDAYLVPFGGDPSGLRYTALQVSTLYRTLNTLPAKHVIVALDACFTGEGKRSILGTVRPLVTTIRAGAVPRSGKLIVLTASRADQESGVLNTKGHGLFTYYLLKGLNGGAVRGGHVTVASLYRYVKPRVREKANLDNRRQTPELEPRNAGSGASVRLR